MFPFAGQRDELNQNRHRVSLLTADDHILPLAYHQLFELI